jgi:phage head maturation protease
MPLNNNQNAEGVETKSLCEFEIKDEAKGEIQSVIATLGVTDRDKDIIRPGAIADGSKVKLSGYGHDAMFGEAPVGKGTVYAVGDKMVFKGNYFMDTTRGREAFSLMKAMGSDQEWSFGFRVLGSEVPDEKEMAKGARRILTKLDAFEVSPVIVGAGIGTATLSAKAAETGDESVETLLDAVVTEARDIVLELRLARMKRLLGQ